MSTPGSTPPPPTEIGKYFARYQDFDYDPAAPAAIEFQRLSVIKKWRLPDGSWSKKGLRHSGRFHAAFGTEFTEKFGFLENDHELEGRKQKWVYLAEVVELDPIPESISGLREAFSGIKVNVFDVLDAEKSGGTVLRFPNVRALADYSYASGKIFPQEKAKGALKFVLNKGIRGAEGGVRLKGGMTLEEALGISMLSI